MTVQIVAVPRQSLVLPLGTLAFMLSGVSLFIWATIEWRREALEAAPVPRKRKLFRGRINALLKFKGLQND